MEAPCPVRTPHHVTKHQTQGRSLVTLVVILERPVILDRSLTHPCVVAPPAEENAAGNQGPRACHTLRAQTPLVALGLFQPALRLRASQALLLTNHPISSLLIVPSPRRPPQVVRQRTRSPGVRGYQYG